MMRRIEPEAVICYHEPFPEMDGNIIYINYELSSWQHMDDDVANTPAPVENRSKTLGSNDGYRVTKYGGYVEKCASHNPTAPAGHRIVKYGGYVVQLGAGSAYGGQWKPKKQADERYLGRPGEIYRSPDGKIETKIGDDGRATVERHHSVHSNPKAHSNPHDHLIEWASDGSPRPGPQINYWDGNVPTLKAWKGMNIVYRTFQYNSKEENAFTSIADFQDCMRRGGEVQFTYNGKDYGVFGKNQPMPESEVKMYIWQTGNDNSEAWYDDSDSLLDYIIEGKKLREIITDVEVFERTI